MTDKIVLMKQIQELVNAQNPINELIAMAASDRNFEINIKDAGNNYIFICFNKNIAIDKIVAGLFAKNLSALAVDLNEHQQKLEQELKSQL